VRVPTTLVSEGVVLELVLKMVLEVVVAAKV
jgi:hypothetical protein